MTIKDKAKAELKDIHNEGAEILKHLIGEESDNGSPPDFRFKYQSWYSRALKAVELLAADRYEEFRRYYEPDPKRKEISYGTYVIQDYLKGAAPNTLTHPNFDHFYQVKLGLYNQVSILSGLMDRMDLVLSNIQEELYVELTDDEIEVAKELLKVNVRAAGAVAGVVLEGYLGKTCSNHGIKFRKKNLGISDFNEALRNDGSYKTPTWRKISYFGDIRNLCTHKKQDDPTVDQVQELIDGTEWVVKNVF